MLYIIICAAFILATVESEYCAVTHFERLCSMDIEIVDRLRSSNLSGLREEEKQLVSSYIEDFENAHGNLKGLMEAESLEGRVRIIMDNPVSRFRMVYRLDNKFPGIQAMGLLDKYNVHLADHIVADHSIGIIYLCIIYDLDPSAVAQGILLDRHTRTSLTAEHCFEIGVHGSNNTFFAMAILFLETALDKAEQDGTMSRNVIEDMLQTAIIQHDEYWDRNDLTASSYAHLFHQKIGPLRRFFPESYMSKRVLAKKLIPSSHFDIELVYWDLCKRGSKESVYNQEKFSCRLDSSTGPYWKLRPLKVEQYSSVPAVYQVYDVIGEKTIKSMESFSVKNVSGDTPDIFRTKIPFGSRRSEQILEHHLSRLHYMGIGNPVYKLMEFTTTSLLPLLDYPERFTSEGKNSFNVYNAGDFGNAHTDLLVTVMYNMEVAEHGGPTAFAISNVAVKPVRGSAILWFTPKGYNSAKVDLHGGCSVLFGRKFAHSTWFYDSKKQCGMERN